MPAYGGMWTLSQVAQAIKNNDWTGVPPTAIEYLVVAGGGTGRIGGGGAGGLLQGSAGITLGSSYTITVGAGGAGAGESWGFSSATLASDSSFGSITATAGGIGGKYAGVNGGSGGGGGSPSNDPAISGGLGISGQGNAGGSSYTNSGSSGSDGGGGGGAGTVGLNAPAILGYGGNGGAGISSAITGTRVVYAGGGGGGGYSTAGIGGIGGGGNGAINGGTATAGTPNTGSGGGGAAYPTGTNAAGGSGIVVIRYPGNVQYFTGGTLNYSNGYIVHTFYSSGVLAPVAPRLFASPDYQIARSLRFNSADSAYLNRTHTASGSQQRFTVSLWTKLGSLVTGTDRFLWANGNAGVNFFAPTLLWKTYDGSYYFQLDYGTEGTLSTNAVYRDPSAWYHIVVNMDTTQATAANRANIYVNGVLQTYRTATYPSQSVNLHCNTAAYPMYVGALNVNSTFIRNFEGYITEINFIDGQQLSAASFGYTEPTTGVWTPLQYTGSYGTNGFYLNFSNPAGLGSDGSGNGNAWTPNNFSVAAGAGNDSLLDSPTNYGVDTGLGGEVRGNYATWSPLAGSTSANPVLSNGNLDVTGGAAYWGRKISTVGMTTGKWYAEVTINSVGDNSLAFGVTNSTPSVDTTNQNGEVAGYSIFIVAYYSAVTAYNRLYNSGYTTLGGGCSVGDVYSLAFDADAAKLYFYKNGSVLGSASGYTFTTNGQPFFFQILAGVAAATGGASTNFGQRAFAYSAPTGFKALCSQNLPESQVGTLPGKYFGAVTYTGSNTTRPIATGVDMATNGGLLWTKGRDLAVSHFLIDTVRGFTKYLATNSTIAEDTYDFGFTSTAFGVTTTNGSGSFNQSPYNYVAWNWAAGGSAVTNTTGSITSSVSANPTTGFSIVTYTGSGTNATVGHGLGIVPSMILQKNRTGYDWRVYHVSAGNTNELYLNLTTAATTASTWNNTTPTTTVFSIGSGSGINGGGFACVAYCWAEVAGYSKFGSYTGNGAADGPFVYCGFRPAYVLIKNTTNTADWRILDLVRNTYNVIGETLQANNTTAGANFTLLDFLSNGFKLRNTFTDFNLSSNTYIFAAFAESPFKYARAR